MPKRSRYPILKSDVEVWIMSLIPKVGPVWWRQSAYTQNQVRSNLELNIAGEKLLEKEIFSLSYQSKASHEGLISAKGIYKTLDGENWQKLSLFADQDWPVYIAKNGWYYVGPYVSQDKGATFTSYIRWEILSQSLEKHLNTPPKQIKLRNLEVTVKNSDQILVKVDAGARELWLKNFISTASWQVIKK